MPYPRAPRHRRRLAPALTLALSALLSIAAITAPAAIAGSYTVSGTCLWEPYNASPAHIAVYGGCGSPMIARNVGGSFNSPAGVGGGWRFAAPPGASLTGATTTVHAIGRSGWQAAVFEEGGGGALLVNCPGPGCPGGDQFVGWTPFMLTGGYALTARMRCGAPSGACSNGDLYGYIEIFDSALTIADYIAPAVSVSGGSLLGGWRSGTQTVSLDADDNVGVKITRVYIDGALRTEESDRPGRCNYGLKVPCPNGGATLTVPTGGLADGAHTVTAQAIDSADNAGGSAGVTFYTAHPAARRHAG
jgi:hypothetical protein